MPVQWCFPIYEYNFSSTIQKTHYNKVIRAGKKVGSIASDVSLKVVVIQKVYDKQSAL